MKKFFEDGQAYITRMKEGGTDPCCAISPGMEEWAAWLDYFHSLGSLPAAVKMVERGTLSSLTVPAKWPEWFDSHYLRPATLPTRSRDGIVSDAERARVSAGLDALANELSMGKPDYERRKLERKNRAREVTRVKPQAVVKTDAQIAAALGEVDAGRLEPSPELLSTLSDQKDTAA